MINEELLSFYCKLYWTKSLHHYICISKHLHLYKTKVHIGLQKSHLPNLYICKKRFPTASADSNNATDLCAAS